MVKIFSLVLFLSFSLSTIQGQSLLEMLDIENQQVEDTLYFEAIFKATRIINGQSIETTGKNNLNFIVSHRFGDINSGGYDFWGLDHNFIRLGIDYGVTDWLDLGIGRSNEQKLTDSYVKIRLKRQSSGVLFFPVTISWVSSILYSDLKWAVPNRDNLFSSRIFYFHELIVARKFNEKISVQIVPGFVHRNLVVTNKDQNDVPYIGFGSRFKLTNRISFNAEYFWMVPGQTADDFINPLAFGFDIETGGHVFQLHFSNSQGRIEKNIPENKKSWLDGEFGFGFNIIRHFNLKRK